MQPLNQLAVVTDLVGARLIMKINFCAESMNEQEFEVSNLNITRRWSLKYTKAALCGYSVVAKANL
jgi:hypothetical protein